MTPNQGPLSLSPPSSPCWCLPIVAEGALDAVRPLWTTAPPRCARRAPRTRRCRSTRSSRCRASSRSWGSSPSTRLCRRPPAPRTHHPHHLIPTPNPPPSLQARVRQFYEFQWIHQHGVSNDFLRDLPETAGDVVLVTDCYDLLIVGSPKETLSKFKAYKKGVVIGSEETCMLNCYENGCFQRNPNGGFVIGFASEMKKLYEYILKESPSDDQYGMGMYMDENCDRVALDDQEFLVMNWISGQRWDEVEFVDGRVKVGNGNKPVAIHMPFMQLDLGKRSNRIRENVLPGYVRPYSKMKWLSLWFSHVINVLKTNRLVRRKVIKVSAAVVGSIFVLVLIALMFRDRS